MLPGTDQMRERGVEDFCMLTLHAPCSLGPKNSAVQQGAAADALLAPGLSSSAGITIQGAD
jgi:hypothetical protein